MLALADNVALMSVAFGLAMGILFIGFCRLPHWSGFALIVLGWALGMYVIIKAPS